MQVTVPYLFPLRASVPKLECRAKQPQVKSKGSIHSMCLLVPWPLVQYVHTLPPTFTLNPQQDTQKRKLGYGVESTIVKRALNF